jgi:hypothetical protein
MSKISRILRERYIDPAFVSRPTSVKGEIIEYQYPSATATVRFYLPGTAEPVTLSNVPVRLTFGGVIEGQPKPGDECIIAFQNGDPAQPYVVMITADDNPGKIRDRQERTISGAELPLGTSDWTRIPVAERPLKEPSQLQMGELGTGPVPF